MGDSDQRGLSLIDLMVGLAIGMAAMVVTLNVAVSFDARRRSVSGMADSQGNAAFAMTLMSREIRMAGHGLGPASALGCIVHRDAPGTANPSFVLTPAAIVAGTNGGSDALTTLAGGERATPASWLISPFSVGQPALQVDTTVGMAVGDSLLLQAAGQSDCALLQVAGIAAGSSFVVQPSTVAGMLPGVVFGTGSAAVNVGALRARRYTVVGQQLRVESYDTSTGNWSGDVLADGVASLQLQYGFDARPGVQTVPQVTWWSDDVIDADGNGTIGANDWRRLLALRMAIVTRSARRNDGQCDAAAPQWFAGAPVTGQLVTTPISVNHLPDWRCWRYRVLETEVPLRNQIWSEP